MARALALLLILCAAAPAQELRSLAKEKFTEGRREFAAANFPRALELFKEAYKLAPYPDLLYNIGRCEEQIGHFRAALDAYERYLAVNPGLEEAKERADRMRALIAEQPPASPEPSPAPLPLPVISTVVVTPLPAPVKPTPVYRKWWLWTAVVGGVAAVALGVGLGIGLSGAEPQRTFPPLGGQ